jgi:hypothetical protein
MNDIDLDNLKSTCLEEQNRYKAEIEKQKLRDYFAGKAMQGMTTWGKDTLELLEKRMGINDYWDYVAENAYLAADAMMKAREQ